MSLIGGIGAMKFLGKARAKVKAAAAARKLKGHNKRAHVSVDMQMKIARDELREAQSSANLHSIVSAISVARYLGQKFGAAAPLLDEAAEMEQAVRAQSPTLSTKMDLRRSPPVRAQIRRFWELLLYECSVLDKDGKREASQDGYARLHSCIARAVSEASGKRRNRLTKDRAIELAKDDWDNDVSRFSSDAYINKWFETCKKAMQERSDAAIAQHGWKALFKELDEDGDGTLDGAEFLAGLRKNGVTEDAISDKEIAKAFKSADKDGGGELDGEEFAAFIKFLDDKAVSGMQLDRTTRALMEMVGNLRKAAAKKIQDLGWQSLFEEIDDDGSGELDLDEFRTALRLTCKIGADQITDAEIAEVFHLIDSDHSQKLSAKEFVTGLRKDEKEGYTMTYDTFEPSMFELIDLWCPGEATEEEYVEFFRTLFRTITTPGPGVDGWDEAILRYDDDGPWNTRALQAPSPPLVAKLAPTQEESEPEPSAPAAEADTTVAAWPKLGLAKRQGEGDNDTASKPKAGGLGRTTSAPVAASQNRQVANYRLRDYKDVRSLIVKGKLDPTLAPSEREEPSSAGELVPGSGQAPAVGGALGRLQSASSAARESLRAAVDNRSPRPWSQGMAGAAGREHEGMDEAVRPRTSSSLLTVDGTVVDRNGKRVSGMLRAQTARSFFSEQGKWETSTSFYDDFLDGPLRFKIVATKRMEPRVPTRRKWGVEAKKDWVGPHREPSPQSSRPSPRTRRLLHHPVRRPVTAENAKDLLVYPSSASFPAVEPHPNVAPVSEFVEPVGGGVMTRGWQFAGPLQPSTPRDVDGGASQEDQLRPEDEQVENDDKDQPGQEDEEDEEEEEDEEDEEEGGAAEAKPVAEEKSWRSHKIAISGSWENSAVRSGRVVAMLTSPRTPPLFSA